jgi:hypothetical protein
MVSAAALTDSTSNNSNSRPESTTETVVVVVESEKPQEGLVRQLEPVPEAEIEEWVIGQSRARHIVVINCTLFLTLSYPRAASRPASADIARY